MMLNNDSNGRWVNGSIGVICDIEKAFKADDEEACLKARLFPDEKIVEVYRHFWEIYRFHFSQKTQSIASEPVGSFFQFPFRLAWAVTVHKSQGKSFDRVIVDTKGGMPFSGQAYTAFSRCTSFEGLVLTSPLEKSSVRTDWRASAFLASLRWRESEKKMPLEDKIKFLRQAINKGETLQLHYLKPDNSKSKRAVRPLSVGETEYRGKSFQGLRAFCLKAGAERSFRIDRILDMSVLPAAK